MQTANNFKNMHIFKPNEIVQALDDSTSIWEEAKIIGIVSDWSVLIKWVHWNTSPVSIIVPENLRIKSLEHWNIRKFQKLDSRPGATKNGRPLRQSTQHTHQPSNYRNFTENPRLLVRHEEILFWDDETKDVCKAVVLTNDPFLFQLTVTISSPGSRFVSYDLLRSRVTTISCEQPDVTTEETDATITENDAASNDTMIVIVPPPAKRPRTKIEEPELDMAGSLVQCNTDGEESVPLTYVPCVNGILKIDSIALYSGKDCRVIKLEFDVSRMKAFVAMVAIDDEDETMRLPAVKVHLKIENYLKDELFDFMQIYQHPINIAFATFSTIKRAVGLSRNKNSHTWVIGPATNLIRKFAGFTTNSHKEIAKFSTIIPDGKCGCPRSWDSVLGQRWDVIPSKSRQVTSHPGTWRQEHLDTLIRTLRFTEHRDFGLFSIRCHITTCEGRFRDEDDYRSLVIHNYLESSKDQFTEV